MAKNKLSIYLIKDGIQENNEIFKNELLKLHVYNENKIAYYVRSNSHQPTWLNNFFEITDAGLFQANAKVVLLVKRIYEGRLRIFALTFGYAKPLFKEGVLEEQFGLKIVLNTVKNNELRKISKLNIGGNQKQSQEQIPKTGKISDFGFNIYSDLMRNVTAATTDEIFGKAIITGGDIFSIAVEKNIHNIEEFLDYCYLKYNDIAYKNNFDWLDNIKAVRSKDLIENLNNYVIEKIKNQDFENIWMAVPDIINWEQVKCFKYSGSRDEFDDIKIEKVIETFDDLAELTMDKFKNKTIKVISAENESEILSWSAQKCLIAEIEYQSKSFCLNNGKWYQIDNNFELIVKREYDNITISELNLPSYSSNGEENYTENEYNENLATSINAALIHRIGEIPYGGGTGNKIEVCDILTNNKELIHIKKSGGSSVLSHLFNQAAVSAEALLDSDFREKYNRKLSEKGMTEYIDNDFKSSNYTIILGIISKYNDARPKIPFFSKVAIRYMVKTLSNLGYQIKIKNIFNVDD